MQAVYVNNRKLKVMIERINKLVSEVNGYLESRIFFISFKTKKIQPLSPSPLPIKLIMSCTPTVPVSQLN